MDNSQLNMILGAIKENKDAIGKQNEKTESHLTTLYEHQTLMRIAIGKLQVKAGMWGLLGAFIGVIGAYVAIVVKKMGT